jgi:glycerol-3-phosphate O-acyltransferase
VLRPFLEAYRIVAEHLERCDASAQFDRSRFLSECRGVGRQYHLQRRIRSADSISQVLFQSALRLAGNRDLLEVGQPDLQARRVAFADEIRSALRRVDVVDALAASRRAGVID